MEATEVQITGHTQLAAAADAITERVTELSIGTKDEAEAAASLLTKAIVPLLGAADLVKKGYHQDHKQACAAETRITAARQALERKILAWRDAAEQKAARDALAETQERLDRADDSKLDQAEALEQQGRDEEAEALLRQPSLAPVAPPESVELEAAKVKPNWVPVVFDFAALARAAADPEQSMVPLDAVQPNKTLLNQQARSLKGNFRWPGCRGENDPKVKPT